MNAEQLAQKMNGREYGEEITKEECREAKEAGLVVVFGASDDLMEFRGAIYDELGAWGGTTAIVTLDGHLLCEPDEDAEMTYREWNERQRHESSGAAKIEALWCAEKDSEGRNVCWTFKTQIPHHEFFIFEDGQTFCRGIVFALTDVAKATEQPPTESEDG